MFTEEQLDQLRGVIREEGKTAVAPLATRQEVEAAVAPLAKQKNLKALQRTVDVMAKLLDQG
jgi:hypothetical protein